VLEGGVPKCAAPAGGVLDDGAAQIEPVRRRQAICRHGSDLDPAVPPVRRYRIADRGRGQQFERRPVAEIGVRLALNEVECDLQIAPKLL
jgi:hypothetical protein